MDDTALSENADRRIEADAKVLAQRSLLHTALGEDCLERHVLDEMQLNRATLQINQALFEYAEAGSGVAALPSGGRLATPGAAESVSWPSQELELVSAVVRKLERFGPLTDEDRKLLARLAASKRNVAAKTDIIREGDTPNHVQVVISGLACRYKILADGKHQIVAFLVPGDFCDLNAGLVERMDHSIATLAPSRIADVPKSMILQLLDRPTLARAVLKAALVDAATLREWIANIGQRTAEQRIAHLFCELLARLEAVGATIGDSFALPISQRELSAAVGLSLVHTNKSLRRLKDSGLAMFDRGRIVIRDLSGLQALSGFTPNYLHNGGACAKKIEPPRP